PPRSHRPTARRHVRGCPRHRHARRRPRVGSGPRGRTRLLQIPMRPIPMRPVAVRAARVGIGAVIAAGLVALAVGPSAADAGDAIDRARRAADTTTYSGTVTVRWADSQGSHAITLDVESAGGVVRLD